MQKNTNTNETIGNEAALREALEIITMGNELANYRKTVTEIYKLMLFVPSNELAECTKQQIIGDLEIFRHLFDKMEEAYLLLEDTKLAS